jgi:hypothetical protein
MSLFNIRCPACGSFYKDVKQKGKTVLTHVSPLSNRQCVATYGYVLFDPCKHCCPETFAECPLCELRFPGFVVEHGTPSSSTCRCGLVHSGKLPEEMRDRLKVALGMHFDLNDLKDLCFDLGINFENIPGGDILSAKVIGLIEYTERYGTFDTLVTAVRTRRANADL